MPTSVSLCVFVYFCVQAYKYIHTVGAIPFGQSRSWRMDLLVYGRWQGQGRAGQGRAGEEDKLYTIEYVTLSPRIPLEYFTGQKFFDHCTGLWRWGCSVSIVSDYRLDDRGSIPDTGQTTFPLAPASRPALSPTQPHIQWVPGVHSPGVKRGRSCVVAGIKELSHCNPFMS
jgi:hypothetical protein